jgi:exodeoxyribonuclease-3
MKIATWNVNGIRARVAEVLDFVAREEPDVLCLQEIKASRENVPEPLRELPGYFCYWHGHKGYSGVGLLLRQATFPHRPAFAHPDFDHETRIVTARLGRLLVASIYVPNGGKDFPAKMKFLEGVERFAARASAEGSWLVVCGDLNVAREERDVHPSLRKLDQIGTTPKERALFEKIVGHGLVDLQRKFAPDDDRLFTWWAPWRNLKQKNVGWRIDYVLAPESLSSIGCSVQRELGTSDHGPLVALLDVAPPQYDPAPEKPAEKQPEAEKGLEPGPSPEPPSPKGQMPLL